jgi:hypothetical protein
MWSRLCASVSHSDGPFFLLCVSVCGYVPKHKAVPVPSPLHAPCVRGATAPFHGAVKWAQTLLPLATVLNPSGGWSKLCQEATRLHRATTQEPNPVLLHGVATCEMNPTPTAGVRKCADRVQQCALAALPVSCWSHTSLPSGMPLPRVAVSPTILAMSVRKVRYSFRATPRRIVFISGMPEPGSNA